ncbi:amiloride-sensitive sodium channel subunit alpha-like [Montipora capricornis]|uniref:amiloride-sensitive sodium channel subunit alpha-like n=1 Tax=Montipora capricornis TaxID=246305 RepID=UPI0035F1CD40
MQSPNKANGSSQKSQQLKSFQERIFECFGYTTAHGYGRVADATDSSLRRCFWLLACAAAFGIFVYQLQDLTSQYLSRPLKTRAWIAHEQNLPFPQVTVCNLNKIRRSKIPEDVLKDYPQILGPISNATNNSSKLHGHKLKTKVHQRLAEYPDDILQAAGHQLQDMILNCEYNNIDCLNEMRDLWTQLTHPKFGNCYTFNGGRDPNNKQITVLMSSLPGHEEGLKLEVNIEQYEYVSELSDEAGVRVFIGDQYLMPFPYELGISAPSGYSTGIMLRKIVIGRLDPFKNHSCEPKSILDDGNIFSRYNVIYSDMACKISCLANTMHEMCGCVYYKLKYTKTQNVCDKSHHATEQCIDDVFKKYSEGICTKDCRQKCREDTFKMTVSAADWPSEYYKDILKEKIGKRGLGNRTGDFHVNFLKLKVYYGALNYEVIDEELAYPFSNFVSDIGGVMGMWIGISALTCVEVLELSASLCYAFWRKFKGKRNSINVVQPRDCPA